MPPYLSANLSTPRLHLHLGLHLITTSSTACSYDLLPTHLLLLPSVCFRPQTVTHLSSSLHRAILYEALEPITASPIITLYRLPPGSSSLQPEPNLITRCHPLNPRHRFLVPIEGHWTPSISARRHTSRNNSREVDQRTSYLPCISAHTASSGRASLPPLPPLSISQTQYKAG